MKLIIPSRNWTTELAKAIENAKPGDIIIVKTKAQIELGQGAKKRMCPSKDISFQLERSTSQ